MKITKKTIIAAVAATSLTIGAIPAYAATPAKTVKAPTAQQQKDSKVVTYAKSLIGTPYKKDGTTKKGFDASGYVQHVYAKFNVQVPRTIKDIYKPGKNVKKPQQGDLVFFDTKNKKPREANFVGIYIGNDEFIAVTVNKGVSTQSLKADYWKKAFLGAQKAPTTPIKKAPVKKK
ncbi:C40 family peptidase [Aciduricibacillus chroicocephali]|uniref:C40 family peptidase n=1 Tax=Aciduricibacillus chroicocephali TaxID=3054939 RepID=A0ABY9KXN3_9BACI|nr:C40 family peptidase [Bacillaceae bacterium 44XB]